MPSFAVYALGFAVVIAGVAYLAYLLHIPQTYIVAIVVILAGIGLVTATQRSKRG